MKEDYEDGWWRALDKMNNVEQSSQEGGNEYSKINLPVSRRIPHNESHATNFNKISSPRKPKVMR